MSAESSIEWTDSTWNPTRGCSRISPGCENCYAERIASRFGIPGGAFFGFAKAGRWTRKVALIADMLEAPLHWKKPRRIFVNSMSDLFHEDLLPEEIAICHRGFRSEFHWKNWFATYRMHINTLPSGLRFAVLVAYANATHESRSK